ncbi:alpha/beta fold hydrolase [Nocardia aurantiaca]|uniref:Alpha/beta fold hydrolase n=1 Tax=Nocardia aurantiaca TaxID=2675850 RepID=A0A6I3L345_9NOCA|nr:alpha/beta fold hydrolase [Nocardia aurantiaca]
MNVPHYIDVDGRRTRVRVAGDPDRPPILLLHGIGRSLEDWAPQFPLLAASHRVIAVDIPGFGFSARLRETSSLSGFARGVARTLDALGEIRPVHMVGNSLGGAVGMSLLVAAPERVASLTLVDSAGFGSEVTALLRLLAVPGLGRLVAAHTTRAGARMFERTIYADPALATKARIEHALAIAEQPDPGSVTYEIARALASWREVRPQWRAALLAAIAEHPRPTLIVWGDRDRVLPSHQLCAASHLIPHARTHLFAGIGHAPQIECPNEFAELITEFVRSLTETGAQRR